MKAFETYKMLVIVRQYTIVISDKKIQNPEAADLVEINICVIRKVSLSVIRLVMSLSIFITFRAQFMSNQCRNPSNAKAFTNFFYLLSSIQFFHQTSKIQHHLN